MLSKKLRWWYRKAGKLFFSSFSTLMCWRAQSNPELRPPAATASPTKESRSRFKYRIFELLWKQKIIIFYTIHAFTVRSIAQFRHSLQMSRVYLWYPLRWLEVMQFWKSVLSWRQNDVWWRGFSRFWFKFLRFGVRTINRSLNTPSPLKSDSSRRISPF